MRFLTMAFGFVLLLAGASAAFAHGYQSGAVRVEHPWAAPTPPGASVGAAYMTITNTGDVPIRLTGAITPAAARVELHEMTMDGGVMRMRPLTQGVVVPPRGSFRFVPGGAHLMLIGLRKALVLEEFIDLRLVFADGRTVDVELYVEAAASHAH
jgi:periplasmic copper chaperone A